MSTKTHPVWDVYDLYRTSRLNVKYYSARLHRLQMANFWMELVLALTTSSSAIAAFTLWDTAAGSLIWQGLGGVSAVLAVLKPLLKLASKMRKMEEVITGFSIMELDLKKMEIEIREKGVYDHELRQRFKRIYNRLEELVVKHHEVKIDKRLRRMCEEEVLRELPTERFFVPEEEETVEM